MSTARAPPSLSALRQSPSIPGSRRCVLSCTAQYHGEARLLPARLLPASVATGSDSACVVLARLQGGSRQWEHSSDEEDEAGMIANAVGIGESTRGEGICTFDERVVRGFLRRCAHKAIRVLAISTAPRAGAQPIGRQLTLRLPCCACHCSKEPPQNDHSRPRSDDGWLRPSL